MYGVFAVGMGLAEIEPRRFGFVAREQPNGGPSPFKIEQPAG
jgi:hypothetical protein